MGDNDRSQLENKAKVKIMRTAFIEREVGGGGISPIAEEFSTQSFFCFVLLFFFPTIPLSLNE